MSRAGEFGIIIVSMLGFCILVYQVHNIQQTLYQQHRVIRASIEKCMINNKQNENLYNELKSSMQQAISHTEDKLEVLQNQVGLIDVVSIQQKCDHAKNTLDQVMETLPLQIQNLQSEFSKSITNLDNNLKLVLAKTTVRLENELASFSQQMHKDTDALNLLHEKIESCQGAIKTIYTDLQSLIQGSTKLHTSVIG